MNKIFIENIKEKSLEIYSNNKNFLNKKLSIRDNKINYKNINEVVENIYLIRYKYSNLYFINTRNYIIIFDNIDNLLSESIKIDDQIIPPYIKTGNQFNSCISMIYIKSKNELHIDYIKILSFCNFGEFNSKTRNIDKIFTKIFEFLLYLNFTGKIKLDDQSRYSQDNKRIIANFRIIYNDIKNASIYSKFGFKINPEKLEIALIIDKKIREIINNEFSR